MTEHTDDPTPSEVDAGRDALRELGVAPLPSDVLSRLEGRLEGELGVRAPVPARPRRRRPRLAFAVPGIVVTLAAVVAIAVIAERGSDGEPPRAAALSQFKTAAPVPALTPKAGSKASAGAATERTDSATVAHVPRVIGQTLGGARSALHARGLRVVVSGACTARVTHQRPGAGALVAPDAVVRLSCGP